MYVRLNPPNCNDTPGWKASRQIHIGIFSTSQSIRPSWSSGYCCQLQSDQDCNIELVRNFCQREFSYLVFSASCFWTNSHEMVNLLMYFFILLEHCLKVSVF